MPTSPTPKLFNFVTKRYDPISADTLQTDAQALNYLPQNPAVQKLYHDLRAKGNSIPESMRLATIALIYSYQEQ